MPLTKRFTEKKQAREWFVCRHNVLLGKIPFLFVSKVKMNPSVVTFFIVVAILALVTYIFHFDVYSKLPGERIVITEKDTKTLSGQLNGLLRLASFQNNRVLWKPMLVSSVVGAMLATLVLSLTAKTGPWQPLIQIFVISMCVFFVMTLLSNYKAYHGPERYHCEQATKLRIMIGESLGHF